MFYLCGGIWVGGVGVLWDECRVWVDVNWDFIRVFCVVNLKLTSQRFTQHFAGLYMEILRSCKNKFINDDHP